MAVYKYVGRNRKGQLKKGTVEAINKNQAIAKLREDGISPREINEAKGLLYKQIQFGKPVKHHHFVIYCRQFATLIRAGISIVDSTHILANQTEDKNLQKVLKAIEDELREGIPFSDAAMKYPKVFPSLFTNMIRAGEAGGRLDETLDRLAAYFEKQYDLRKKVQSAMAYPITLLVVTILVVIFLMVTIIPSFTDMFSQFDTELPAITRFVIRTSTVVEQFWFVLVIAVAAMVFMIQFFMRTNESFNYKVHLLLLKMPVFGKLRQKSILARMTRTLSSLLDSSVPILQALSIAERVTDDPVIGKIVLNARDNLEKGDRLSEPFRKSWVIPPLVTQMIHIGEESGSLEFMLAKVADFYEAEVDRSADTLKSLIEPIMIIILAVAVGTIILSIMVPMFTIYQNY